MCKTSRGSPFKLSLPKFTEHLDEDQANSVWTGKDFDKKIKIG